MTLDWGSSAIITAPISSPFRYIPKCHSLQPRHLGWELLFAAVCTFRLPPVIVTLTNRLVYVILFLARPLGVFFFSCGSTYSATEIILIFSRTRYYSGSVAPRG